MPDDPCAAAADRCHRLLPVPVGHTWRFTDFDVPGWVTGAPHDAAGTPYGHVAALARDDGLTLTVPAHRLTGPDRDAVIDVLTALRHRRTTPAQVARLIAEHAAWRAHHQPT